MNTKVAENGVIELSRENFSRREDRDVSAVVPATATPMSMLAVAVQKGMDPDTIGKLLALQKEWEANEARKAFVAALAAFKADPPVLHKNKHVSYALKTGGVTDYWHVTLDEASAAIGAKLAPHGLAHSWLVEQIEGGQVKVTCSLTHRGGHRESVWMQASRDDSGSKNNIQALGSTVTYLERYTLLAVTGMAAGDQDDDGREAGGEPEIIPDPAGKKALEACGSMAALQAAWKALTAEQRATLNAVKESCKKAIKDADIAAGQK